MKTPSERIVNAIVQGYDTTADIAQYLGLGKDTNNVSACLRRMMHKGVVQMHKHKGRRYTYTLTGVPLVVRNPRNHEVIREIEISPTESAGSAVLNEYLYGWKA